MRYNDRYIFEYSHTSDAPDYITHIKWYDEIAYGYTMIDVYYDEEDKCYVITKIWDRYRHKEYRTSTEAEARKIFDALFDEELTKGKAEFEKNYIRH